MAASSRVRTRTCGGRARLADLRLPAGEYILNLYPSSAVSSPYALTATLGRARGRRTRNPTPCVADGRGARPRQAGRSAVACRPATCTTGTPWTSMTPSRRRSRDIRLIWRDGPSRRLCLNDATGNPLQCRDGRAGRVAVRTPPAAGHRHPERVRRRERADSTYLLRVDATTAPAADFEAEPNDEPRTASLVVDGRDPRPVLGPGLRLLPGGHHG